MPDYSMLALEVTGDAQWSPEKIRQALGVISANKMNALVFHEADMFNKFVYPSNFRPETSTWDGPGRRGIGAFVNCRAYLSDVSRQCARNNVDFFLQIKELAYPDEFPEDVPDLAKNGIVCPTHPAWPDLIERRYSEVCELLPDLTGFIISVGTQEGRASLTNRRCKCERCLNTADVDWHRWVVGSIHKVTAKYGKRLVVREFSYNSEDQLAVVASLRELPDDIEYAVKPYARDYYIPWPDNPALPAMRDRTKWLEYDVHGQYFGWGVFPVTMLPDEVQRMRSGAEAGCTHVLMRVDWERINGLWAPETFGAVNIATAALVAQDPSRSEADILAQALVATGVVAPTASDEDALAIAELWLEMYPIAIRVLYALGNVYNASSMVPNGIAQGWSYMHNLHQLKGWEHDSIGSLEVADSDALEALLAEKRTAKKDYLEWDLRAQDWTSSGVLSLPDPCEVGDVLGWSRLYVEAMCDSARVVMLVKASEARPLLEHERQELIEASESLRVHRETADRRYNRGGQTHHVKVLIDPERIDRMLEGARSALELVEAK